MEHELSHNITLEKGFHVPSHVDAIAMLLKHPYSWCMIEAHNWAL